MAEILQNPNKLAMLFVMVGLGIACFAYLVIMWIKDSKPKADTVEVVRCKDCKYNDPQKALADDSLWCCYWGIDPDPDDFCSCGSRKDGKDGT